MQKITVLGTLVLGFLALNSCQPKDKTAYKLKAADTDLLHRSVRQVTDNIVYDIFSPPVASRIYAYSCVAGYEALRNDFADYQSLGEQLNGLGEIPKPEAGKDYCFPLASVRAITTVGRKLIFSEDKMDEFRAKIEADFAAFGVPKDVYQRSIIYGDSVAKVILAWADKDNYKQLRTATKYTVSNDPAKWRPTPPMYMDAVEPHWNQIRPFTLDSAAQFAPVAPASFDKNPKSVFYKLADEVYKTGNNLTAEQREIAKFWDCNPFVANVEGHVMFASKKISPGGHWINIFRQVADVKKLTPIQVMETYALLSLGLADGFISCWDEKYRRNVIRPESYINQYIDPKWVPLLQTPPFPEYTSGHSVVSGASSVILTQLLGDGVAFRDTTELEFGMTARSFASFNEAAAQASVSRLYGGIHYRPALDNGLVQGESVGKWVLRKVQTHAK